jgi:small subunit ribosomal protein S6
MIERYTQLMADNGGKVHRTEDWGRRQLAYPINKIHKAHYVLMNIECGGETFEELSSLFRFNDAVLRNLMIKCKDTITEESLILKGERETKERKARSEAKRKVEEEAAAEAAAEAATKAAAEAATKAAAEAATEASTDEEEPGPDSPAIEDSNADMQSEEETIDSKIEEIAEVLPAEDGASPDTDLKE